MPRFQLKYAVIVVSLSITAMSTCSAFLILFFQVGPGVHAVTLLDRGASGLWLLGFAGLFLLNVVANFLIAIVLTHRMVGPLYACERFIRKLQEGQYAEKIRPRKLDEFEDLMTQLNHLAVKLGMTAKTELESDLGPPAASFSSGQGEEGSAMLVMMLALALIGISLSFFYNSQSNLWQKTNVHDSTIANLRSFEANLLAVINDPDAWTNTYQVSSTLRSCLTDSSFNCPVGTYSLDVRDADNSIYYHSGESINRYGSVCSPLGPPDCMFSYRVAWTPQCPPAGPCNQPAINITVSLTSIQTPAIDTDNFVSQVTLQ